MKKTQKLIWLLAAAGLLAVSCVAEKAEPAPVEVPGADEVTAVAAAPATKTYVEDLQVLWAEGDLLTVFPGRDVNSKYVLKSEPGKTFGTFTKVSGSLLGDPLPGYAAVYPYADDVTIDKDGTFTLTLPGEQTYAENSFGPGANTMVSWSEGGYLPFQNVCGYFVMSLTGNVEVNSIEFFGGADEVLAGKATVSMGDFEEEEGPVVAFDKSATGTSIVLNCPEPVQLDPETPTEFWIVVPPASYGMGIYVKVTYNGDKVLQEGSAEKTVPIVRSQIYRMENLDITVEEDDDLIPVEECVDLTKPLTWPTNQTWQEGSTLLPSAFADLATAQWVWGENGANYPEGYPTFDTNKDMNRVRCVWKGDGLVFTVPVLEIPADASLVLYLPWRTGKKAPKCWAVEACLDGENWVPMALTSSVEDSAYMTYKDAEGNEAVAPLYVTKEDKSHYVEATLKVADAVKQALVKVRVVAVANLEVNGTVYANSPSSNSACHVYLPKYENGGVSFDGPTLVVK